MSFLLRSFSKPNNLKQAYNKISVMACNKQYIKYGDLIHNKSKEAFYLPIENEDDAFILYKRRNGVLELYETMVPDHLRGHGIGNELAKEVFDYISANNLKIIITCDFLQKFVQENPEYENIVIHENN